MSMLRWIKKKASGTNLMFSITLLLFVVMYVGGVIVYQRQGFANVQTFMNMLIDNAALIIAAAGATMVIITGGIDISIGSVIGVVCMMLAYMMQVLEMNVWVSIGIVLVFGLAFGFLQGFLIAYFKIQPFVVTLAGLFFCRGLTAMISVNQIAITSNETFLNMATKNIYLPFGAVVNKHGVKLFPFIHPSVLIALVILLIVWYMLRYTRFGRSVFAIGGNEHSAMLMGLNVRRTKLRVYAINGFLSAMAGFVFCLNTTSGFVEQARGYEIEVIASTVIGGTLLTGGFGTAIGSFFGVLIKAIIETYIRCNGTLSSWWNKIVLAAMLCFVIVLQSIYAAIRRRREQ